MKETIGTPSKGRSTGLIACGGNPQLSRRLTMALAAMALSSVASAQTWTFTTCGVSGALGPDQTACDAAYAGTTLEGNVAVSAGIQSWTVPFTGSYRITVVGASGKSADPGFEGGRGASLSAEFSFADGENLKVLVGQRGQEDGESCNGGGGGGSFAVSAADEPLLVAGGGGGTRTSVAQNGCDASLTTFAGLGSGSASTSSCDLKLEDEGLGGVISSSSWGSGGAGFFGGGEAESNFSITSNEPAQPWADGMAGGTGSAPGGFGGGGQGNGSCGGGGGGGYSGGDGGKIAGGGASFTASTATDLVASIVSGRGDGSVIIEATDVAPLPDPAQSSVMVFGSTTVDVGSEVDIQVTVVDTEGQPVSGLEITLTPDPASGVAVMPSAPVATDGAGIAMFSVSSSEAQTVLFTASYNPDLGSVAVTWSPPQAQDAEPIPVLGISQLSSLMVLISVLSGFWMRRRR